MTVEARHKLHQRLAQVLGSEEAATFMEYMPPVGWADVATKRDLDHLAVTTKRDLDHLATEQRGEMRVLEASLRGEMATLGGDLRAEMATLGGELRTDMATLGGDLRTELANGLRLQTFAILGGGSVLVGLGSVLSHLLG